MSFRQIRSDDEKLGKCLSPSSCSTCLRVRHEYVDYEQLVEIADNKLDATDREILDFHLKFCQTCREDVRSFLAFRDELAKETAADYASVSPQIVQTERSAWTRWGVLAWKPAYAAAVAIIAIAIVVAIIATKRRAANLEAIRTPLQNNNPVAVQTPTQTIGASNNKPVPPAPVPSTMSPIAHASPTLPLKGPQSVNSPKRASAAIALNDEGGRKVAIDQAGLVSGLDDVVPRTRDEIAKAVVEKIDTPEILTRLSRTDITLRGPNSDQLFKLRSPARTVVITDRPAFEWDKLPGATSYRVYVGDLRGHEVATSEELSPDRMRWKPPAPLKRGEIYSWAVAAVVGGKEVLSPGASAPEMRFQILAAVDLQRLSQLKKTRSYLVVGVFYVKVGLLTDAERELRELVHLNPNDEAPKRLLRSVQLIRGTLP